VRQYLTRLEPAKNPDLGDLLYHIIKTVKMNSPTRISRKDALVAVAEIAPGRDPQILFEQWERALREPKVVGNWAVSYSVYSDSLVIEYLPDWSQIERAIDIRSRKLQSDLAEVISALSPNGFSYFLANLFSRVDWASNVVITKLSRDGGIDFHGYYLYPDLVRVPLFGQAKHWKGKVGSDQIRTFIGSVIPRAKGRASVGIYVCAGGFTPEALKEIQGAPFRLIKYDTADLIKLMIECRVGVEDFKPQSLRIDGSFWDEIAE
jgi:restriction endonuclease Mrr